VIAHSHARARTMRRSLRCISPVSAALTIPHRSVGVDAAAPSNKHGRDRCVAVLVRAKPAERDAAPVCHATSIDIACASWPSRLLAEEQIERVGP
jgi:hypothetical protein